MSRIAVSPDLLEQAVFLACAGAAERGEAAPGEWRHRRLERAYRLRADPAAERRFARVHAVLFRRFGLARALGEVLRAHGLVGGRVSAVRVRTAPGRAAEGIELLRSLDGGAPALVILLRAATLADPAAVQVRLHRDARKAADLLDPGFRWDGSGEEGSPARRETVRVRYGAAWDAWTDGRLLRRGLPRPVTEAEQAASFAAAFGGALSPAEMEGARRRLAASATLAHGDLLRAARNPGSLVDGPVAAGGGEGRDQGPVGGAPCPLCRFPTFDWAPPPVAPHPALRAVLEDLRPGWVEADGACRQCVMLASARVGGGVAGAAPTP